MILRSTIVPNLLKQYLGLTKVHQCPETAEIIPWSDQGSESIETNYAPTRSNHKPRTCTNVLDPTIPWSDQGAPMSRIELLVPRYKFIRNSKLFNDEYSNEMYTFSCINLVLQI